MKTARPQVVYNLRRLVEDMASRGWMNTDLARAAEVSDSTVTKFFNGERRTPRTMKKFALALDHPISRYLIRSTDKTGRAA